MNISKIYVVSNMKLFSEYIINEGVENFDNIYTYILSQIISFAQLSDIINFISDENMILKDNIFEYKNTMFFPIINQDLISFFKGWVTI